jgi:hypothetical protein
VHTPRPRPSQTALRFTLSPTHPPCAPALSLLGPLGLCLLGLAALGLGVLVYLTDRAALPSALVNQAPGLAGRHLFGSAAQWLPSFVHTLAFSLFTAVALPARSAARYGACAVWALVNMGFEMGQHAAVKTSLAAGLHEWLGHSAPVRRLGAYFLTGTFDVADLLAALGGALAAAALIFVSQTQQERRHVS